MTTSEVPLRPVKKLKVKTGCITCRIRKVKCDEGRPSCKRCKDTGRTCDGYAAPAVMQGQTSQQPVLQHRVKQKTDIQTDVTLLSIAGTPEERRFLDFFNRHTAPALSGTFDGSFWTYLLPQLSQSEPAIRHALQAVGSLHAQYEAINDPWQKKCVTSHQFALQQYNRAISSLKQRISSQESAEVALMCCVLFICLECLRGNREWALSHLQNGLNILSMARAKQEDLRAVKCHSFGSEYVEQKLRQIFSRLLAQLTLTLHAKPISDSSALEPSDRDPICALPSKFSNLFEAKSSLDTLIMSALRFVQSAVGHKYMKPPTAAAEMQQFELQSQFQQWQRSFEPLMEVTGALDHQLLLLLIHHKSTYIWLSTCLTGNETIFDTYTEEFETIITCAQYLDPTSDGKFLFTLDMAKIPPLFLTAIKCRIPHIRHRAVELLNAIPGREGLWEAKTHAKVAERTVAIEEAMFQGMDGVPIESCRIKNVQVMSDMTIDPPRNYVLFHTKPNGLDAEWVVWEEDIIV
ncbi:hypothetical protein F5884DRAFT_799421 [Xylogone sp. PMI_703]|nr:hypothetical protein F5884DRAFT_799421 [Xylogone sp. PMI_703]